jgi:RecT family
MQEQKMMEMEMAEIAVVPNNAVRAGMDTVGGFELMQRQARMLSSSSMVPNDYKGPSGFSNCMIALDISQRMGIPPIMVTQNMHVIHGRPTWGAPFLISSVNGCGRYSAIRYEFNGLEGDAWGCRAVATERSTGFVLEGPWVTIGIARAEGWLGKSGSKWKTMPELMLRYRAASWWVRLYAPEVSMGMLTDDEAYDISDAKKQPSGNQIRQPQIVEIAEIIEPDDSPAPAEHHAPPREDTRDDKITGPIRYVKYAMKCLEMAKTETEIGSIMDRLEPSVLHNEAVKKAAADAIKRLIDDAQSKTPAQQFDDETFPGDRP